MTTRPDITSLGGPLAENTLRASDLAELREDIVSYDGRNNGNYYGRLVRLQATLFRLGPAMLAEIDRLEAEISDGHQLMRSLAQESADPGVATFAWLERNRRYE